MKKNNQGVFTGPNAIKDFLCPDNNAFVPLVELPPSLNVFLDDKVHIFAKATFLTPLLNIKQFAALNLLETASADGNLKGVHTLVESSSGNMALSLTILAKQFGISHIVAVLSRDIAPSKLEILRLFGVDIKFSDTSQGAVNGVDYAKKLGEQDGWLNLGQYENDANPTGHYKYLAPQIWDQTGGAITIFCAGLGTTGTMLGSARYFKKRAPEITIIGVMPAHDSVPGVRSIKRLKEVSFAWKNVPDYTAVVATKDAFKKSLELCRIGIMAGPSSGMALVGLLHTLEKHKSSGTLDKFRNADGEIIAVFVSPDSILPYLDKYSTHLDADDLQVIN